MVRKSFLVCCEIRKKHLLYSSFTSKNYFQMQIENKKCVTLDVPQDCWYVDWDVTHTTT